MREKFEILSLSEKIQISQSLRDDTSVNQLTTSSFRSIAPNPIAIPTACVIPYTCCSQGPIPKPTVLCKTLYIQKTAFYTSLL
jgi:hypothetical protein